MNIKITGVKKLADKRKHAADKLQGKRGDPLKAAVHRAGTAVEKQAKLNVTGGHPLWVRTGHLKASINTQSSRIGSKVRATIGTAVKYGITHEKGKPPRIYPAKGKSKGYVRIKSKRGWFTISEKAGKGYIRVRKRSWLGPAFHKKTPVVHKIIERAVHRIMADG